MLLLEVYKNRYRKENISIGGSKQDRYTFLNSFNRDVAKRIYITLGVYEFLNIHVFNWYKAFYSASSSTFRHPDFVRAVRWLRVAFPMVYLYLQRAISS